MNRSDRVLNRDHYFVEWEAARMASIKRYLFRTIKSIASRYGFEIRRTSSSMGHMMSFLARLRRNGLRPQRILDVGANEGNWSREAKSVFPEAQFVLIEPQEEMRSQLEAFCRETPGSAWKQAGAGREPGELVLTIWPDRAGSSLLAPEDYQTSYERRRIPIVTIDSLFDSDDQLPQLAKLDIQGFELEALAGASKLFGPAECIIVEVNLFRPTLAVPLFADVVAFFDDRNYKVYDIPGHLRRPLDNALAQVDLAFVPKGGVLDRDQRWDSKDV